MLNSLSIGDFDRRTVLIIGNSSFNETPFKERELILKKTTLELAPSHFKFAKAIIVAHQPFQETSVKDCFERLFPIAKNYGLAQKVIVHSEKDFSAIMNLVKGATSDHFYLKERITDLAEKIARYSAGPPDNSTSIVGDIANLDEEAKLVLRRSFFDCEKIHIKSIAGGKDANHLFKVYAWMKNSEVGPLPLPFFAKISSPEKINRELQNYRVYTDLYMSFQYRPNCRLERCVQTNNYKSLVGDFVDESISLRMALEDIHHSGIIFSLFERSLKSFRIQPFVAGKTPSAGALVRFVDDRIDIDKLMKRSDVITKAKELGLTTDVGLLHEKLKKICPSSCMIGPIHGDLNSRNVMVRGSDAILIDFSAINPSGPLTADPATLEISLSFELGENDPPSFGNWRAFIDEAYSPDQLLKPLSLSEEIPTEFSWLRRAIREIRHILIGCECCAEEIKVIIVCYLMRIARLAPEKTIIEKDKMEFAYRAYALVIAERIINSLEKEQKG